MRRAVAVSLIVVAWWSSDGRAKTKTKRQIAQAVVEKYAFEAYAEWAVQHPDKRCPDKIAELDAFMTPAETKDPWGRAYKMKCGDNLPAGARQMAVWSVGEDGKDGTCDDVQSWDRDHACK